MTKVRTSTQVFHYFSQIAISPLKSLESTIFHFKNSERAFEPSSCFHVSFRYFLAIHEK